MPLANLLCLAALSGLLPEFTAVTREPVPRQESLRERFRGLVVRDQVQPAWIDGARCWYVVRDENGEEELVLVDALAEPAGRRRTLMRGDELLRAFGVPAPTAGIEEIRSTRERDVLRVLVNTKTQWLLNVITLESTRIRDVLEWEREQRKAQESPGTPAPRPEPDPGDEESEGTLSPDGSLLAYVENSELWVVPIYRGSRVAAPVALPRDGTPGSECSGPLKWSPDGRYLSAFSRTPAQPHTVTVIESSPDDDPQPKVVAFENYLKPGDRIERVQPRLFALTGNPKAPLRAVPIGNEELFPNPWSIRRLRWDQDSSRFTFLYNERGHRVLRLIAVDAATGQASALINEEPATFFDYAGKLYCRHLASRGEFLWMSERSGWNHLYAVDAATGATRAITFGEWVVRGVESVDAHERDVILRVMGRRSGEDPYHVHFVRVDLANGAITALTEGEGTHDLRWSPNGLWYVDTWSRVDRPPVRELRSGADGALVVQLESADASALEKAGWRAPERFVAKGRDGETDIHGIVYRPTHWSPDSSYPVIESIYAGPHGAHVPKRWSVHRKQRDLAELGFIVVQIDGMGTNWRSKAFHDVCWKNLGDAGFPDRIQWIRALAAKDSTVDLSRVGIYGGSAGGQNAMRALIAHGDFYHAAVADCGCHDNRMDKIWWNELWMSWPIGPQYDESSNVVQAHRMTGDLLLIVGELDRNVDPASTMQVVNALVRADKDFELLVLPGVGHGAAETPYGTRRRRDFFVRHLR